MTITNLGSGQYRVDTGRLTADLRPICDVCVLRDSALRTDYSGQGIHTVPQIRVKLGPISLARVSELAIGQSAEF